MLNPFFVYNIMTSLVLILYAIPVSKFNTRLDGLFLLLIVFSIFLSTVLGFKYKNYFKYKDAAVSNKKKYIPLIIIICLSCFEFFYTKDIPFFSTTIHGINDYKEFESIPFLHMFTSMLALYYSAYYSYHAISYKKNRLFNILSFLIINVLMLLFNMRSFFMISFFIFANILISKLRTLKIIKVWHYIVSLIVIIIILFFFGCYGNMREGYDWNDNRYIENLGLYHSWNDNIPKQYMWSYSYLTSPLANLNFNIVNENVSFEFINLFYEIIPVSISKRLPYYGQGNYCILIRPYFIDRFDWDYFGIIEKTDNYNFVSNAKIDKSNYSDHLPIKFEIM